MNCPNCGAPEKTRVKLCTSCGEAYSNEDLLELRKLEFLIAETSSWDVPAGMRRPYMERLSNLRARVLRRLPAAMTPAAEAAIPTAPKSTTVEAALPEPDAEARSVPAPKKEQVPFDQWLLSERNIKLALYVGGGLLVIAGIIFIGINWTRIPGLGKLGITLLASSLMYLGGFLLFRRPAFRIGGVALLAVASGFLTLNFAVLQIYMTGPSGLADDVMWLIAAPICTLVYIGTAYWTQTKLFTYLSLIGVVNILLAALQVLEAILLVYLFAFSLLTYAILILGWLVKGTRHANYTTQPFMLVSQVGQPIIFLFGLSSWVIETGCQSCEAGSPWLSVFTLGVGLVFYLTSDVLFGWILARWVSAFIFPTVAFATLVEFEFPDRGIVFSLMAIAFLYMGMGYLLEKRNGTRSKGWPLYAGAFVVGLFATAIALDDRMNLIWMLLGDVILLAATAVIFKDMRWSYGATWLFMLPTFLFVDLNVADLTHQGAWMGILGLLYTMVTFAIGKKNFSLGASFLSAAAFLSVLSVGITWTNESLVSIVLGVFAILYGITAYWLDWIWLLLPAIGAIDLLGLSLNLLSIGSGRLDERLTLSYTVLGSVFVLGTLLLRVLKKDRWGWPLLSFGALNLVGAYISGLFLTDPIAVGQSINLAILTLWFSWLYRDQFKDHKLPPLLSYVGVLSLFVAHFYVLHWVGDPESVSWAPYSAAVCGVFITTSLLLPGEPLKSLYAHPLHHLGILLMLVPLIGSVAVSIENDLPLLAASTFGIAGIILAADALARRKWVLGYSAAGCFVVVIWAVLFFYDIDELQAYVVPISTVLLVIGWIERLRENAGAYLLVTVGGLLSLMGASFIQSIPDNGLLYALLLGLESLAAFTWGIYHSTRIYVQFGFIAFTLNGIVQLGPGFVELPRWIQIGLTGSILFGGGLLALFQRDRLMRTRSRLSERWKSFDQ